jgi:hypothetical protein
MSEINLSHWELTFKQDADGSQPMSPAIRERLELVRGFHAGIEQTTGKEQLEALYNDFWKSPTISHFDKQALDSVYWSRLRQLKLFTVPNKNS